MLIKLQQLQWLYILVHYTKYYYMTFPTSTSQQVKPIPHINKYKRIIWFYIFAEKARNRLYKAGSNVSVLLFSLTVSLTTSKNAMFSNHHNYTFRSVFQLLWKNDLRNCKSFSWNQKLNECFVRNKYLF